MAIRACGKRFQAYSFVDVALLDGVWLVIVAAVAGVFYVLTWMAGLTGYLTLLSVVEREIVHLQFSWQPGCHRMTGLALQPKKPGVDFGLGMAANTFSRRAQIHLILMASLAGGFCVGAL